MFMNIKSIASQEAEKYYTLREFKNAYIHGFNKCMELLAGSEGDIEQTALDIYQEADKAMGIGIESIINHLKQLLAIHTAKMLGDRWIYTVDGMPERLPEHQVGDPVYDNSSITVYVSDYSDDVYNAYWDFSNNCWRHTLDDEILNDVVAWITKPQSHNK